MSVIAAIETEFSATAFQFQWLCRERQSVDGGEFYTYVLLNVKLILLVIFN